MENHELTYTKYTLYSKILSRQKEPAPQSNRNKQQIRTPYKEHEHVGLPP